MKYFLLSLIVLLSGCSVTKPVTSTKFPDVPHQLLEHCPKLKTVDVRDPSIITLSKTVLENYTNYHECSNKIDLWIEWYNKQKSIIDKK